MNPYSNKPQKAIDLIHRVQAVNLTKPSHEAMIEDIKMMQVKVRPVEGDLFSVKHTENQFIHSLWKVSKIEQIAREATNLLDDIEAENFFSYLDTVEENRLYSEPERHPEDMNVVTLEIFKQEEPESRLAN